MKTNTDEKKPAEKVREDERREREARRSAETLGLCFRCGAVLPLGQAHLHDCSAQRPS